MTEARNVKDVARTVRLDPDIRGLAGRMQLRRKEAEGLVKAGKIQHLNFMDDGAIYVKLQSHLEWLERAMGEGPGDMDALKQAADLAAYGLEAARRAEATRQPATAPGQSESDQGKEGDVGH